MQPLKIHVKKSLYFLFLIISTSDLIKVFLFQELTVSMNKYSNQPHHQTAYEVDTDNLFTMLPSRGWDMIGSKLPLCPQS